jgi:hypothetical protein
MHAGIASGSGLFRAGRFEPAFGEAGDRSLRRVTGFGRKDRFVPQDAGKYLLVKGLPEVIDAVI